jgi:sphinganine-1-phosphate aldolase
MRPHGADRGVGALLAHGMVEPIAELSDIAVTADVPLHVDGCVEGFFLPFAKELGHPFRSSTFICRVSRRCRPMCTSSPMRRWARLCHLPVGDLYRFHPFEFSDWTGGLYSVPTFAGSRPGPALAAAWAAMHALGHVGYLRMTRMCLEATARLAARIEAIDGLQVVVEPTVNIICFRATELDIGAVRRRCATAAG